VEKNQKDVKMNRIWIAIAIGLVLQASAGAVPEYVNYQARLFDSGGAPLQGAYAVSFSIFDATEGGSLVWGPFQCDGGSGDGHADLAVVWDGWFNVILGAKDTAGREISSAFASRDGMPRFMEMEVSGETIAPRQQFLSVPYAAHAKEADYAFQGVPTGTILAFYGQTAPDGWFLCDGGQIPADERYDALRALVGETTPDLRGRVVLGVDGAANRVTSPAADFLGGAAGEDQHTLTVNEMPAHRHTWNYSWEQDDSGYGGSYNEFTVRPGPWPNPQGYAYPIADTGGGQPHNNMPPYIAVNWIIKY
jgi:microcystin-dependent protein